jgi:hypothetical protein
MNRKGDKNNIVLVSNNIKRNIWIKYHELTNVAIDIEEFVVVIV